MSVFGAVVVFVMAWWVGFLPMLSIGHRSQLDAGDVVTGSERGAPARPRLLRAAVLATLFASAMTLGLSVVLQFGLIPAPN